MAKRSFLKNVLTKCLSIALVLSFSLGMVACNTQASLQSSASSLGSDLTVWVIDGNTEKILQRRLDSAGDTYVDYSNYYSNKDVRIGVFQNEIESTNIVLTAGSTRINSYNIELSDLTNGDDVLKADAFTVYNQKYIENTPMEGIYGAGWYPDCVLPFDKAIAYAENFVDPYTHQAIFLTVQPPKGQAPGDYTGSFKITADGKDYNVNVTVTVYDYELGDTPVAVYAAGGSADTMQAGELDSTMEMVTKYYDFFVDFRCSPGHLPGYQSNVQMVGGFDVFTDEWIEQARKYALNDKVSRYMLPYQTYSAPITYEAEKKDSAGKTVYETNPDGSFKLNEKGEKIPVMAEYLETHNLLNGGYWVRALRKFVKGCFDNYEDEANRTFVADIIAKCGTYFVYFDEFSSTAGKDLTAICTLQFVEYAAHLLHDEFEHEWTNDSTKELTPEEEGILDSILSIEHKAISTSTAPLEDSDYVVRYTFQFNDNASGTDVTEWTKNYEYTFREGDTSPEKVGKSRVKFNGSSCTFEIGKLTQCVFVTGVTHYATAQAREEFNNYAQMCDLYDHKQWFYTAENPKYPYVNNHLDTSLWGIRAMGWMLAEYNANGNLYWSSSLARQYVTVSPLYVDYIQDYYQTSERYKGTNGDGYVAYVGRPYDVFGPLASIRLHAIRDGNEDYDLLYYLEQYYSDRAEAKGEVYNDEGYTNIVKIMTQPLYNGVQTIKTTNDQTIYNSRKFLAQLLSMAKNTGAVIENYEIVNGGALFTVSAPSGVEVLLGNNVQSGVTDAYGITTYSIFVPFTSSSQNLVISAKDAIGDLYSANFTIDALQKQIVGGDYEKDSYVLPSEVGKLEVDAGKVSVENIMEGDEAISALKGTFYNYLSVNANGNFVKVANEGSIETDFAMIDRTNVIIKIQRYLKLNSGAYFETSIGDLIMGADGEYHKIDTENVNDVTKLIRYSFNGTDYVEDMVNGTFVKGFDAEEQPVYVEFDPESLDKSSTIVLAYNKVGDDYVETLSGKYRKGINGDFIEVLDGEEDRFYDYGEARHQLVLNLASLKINTTTKLLAIKLYSSIDAEITVGGLAGTQVAYSAERYQLKANEWVEIHVTPASVGATTSRVLKELRFRYDGVQAEGAILAVGTIYVIK